MDGTTMTRQTDGYFQRFGFCERQIQVPPHPEVSLIVVIPCFNEPDLAKSLESLHRSERPKGGVEVIVVVNSASDSSSVVLEQNHRSLHQARWWIETQKHPKLTVHLIHATDLPSRHAGVGLARKVGMDEALRRFDDIGKMEEGIILCFDADCECAPNYLASVEEHFRIQRGSPGCSIYFEHPLEGELPPAVYDAVTNYELHLRYYVQALRYAQFPHACHTIGSSMAVRARAYMEQGGMNRRQAGEDFYFLHKLIPLGGFTELNGTAVYPSPRASDRVPFGTGRAVSEWPGKGKTYPLQAFEDLRLLLKTVPMHLAPPTGLPESLQTFLQDQNFSAALEEIRRNTSTAEAFRKRFFRWFDGFRVMKFVHHARDRFYGEQETGAAAAELLARIGRQPEGRSLRELLLTYRALQRPGFSG
jgi:glycosyltransferase involved in cell wall biosynthesis